MPYEFPKRALKTKEVLHPDDLTEDASTPTEVLSGKLDAHNLSETINIAKAKRDNAALYKLHLAYTDGHFGFGSESPYYQPNSPAMGATFTSLANGMAWTGVASTTFTAEQNLKLWINAFVQYVWGEWPEEKQTGDDVFPGHKYQFGPNYPSAVYEPTPLGGRAEGYVGENPVYGARVQFAIRVNNRVLEWTITGSQDTAQQSTVPIKPRKDRTTASQFPGVAAQRTPQRASLGPAALPVRIGAVYEVPAGEVTVELVARRELDFRYTRHWGGYENSNIIQIFSRQILAMEMPAWPRSSEAVASISVPAVTEEETVDRETLWTNRLEVVQTEVNAVTDTHIAPGAIRHEHLSSPVKGNVSNDTDPSEAYVYRNRLAGALTPTDYDNAIYITWNYQDSEVSGWCMVGRRSGIPYIPNNFSGWSTSGSADEFVRVLPSGSSFTFGPSNPGWLIVFADVQLISNEPEGSRYSKGARNVGYNGSFSMFRIGVHLSGDANDKWKLYARSEAMVNNFNNWGQLLAGADLAMFRVDDHFNVPMMLAIDFTNQTTPITIDGIGVFTTGVTNYYEKGPYNELKRGYISAFALEV